MVKETTNKVEDVTDEAKDVADEGVTLRAYPDVCRQISWLSTGDPATPYFDTIDGVNWEIDIKASGQDEPVTYTLKVGGEEILDFDEWPSFWYRPNV